MRIRKLLSGLALLVAATSMAGSAMADDFAPPVFRGGPLSTTQGWEFLTPQDPLTPDDPNVPLVIGNGGGVPTASYGGMGWVPFDGDGGVLGAPGGQFNLYIPNWIDFEPYKLMWVQITFAGSPTNAPYIVNVGAQDNLPGSVTVVADPPVLYPIPLRIGVYGFAQQFTFFPNPDWEIMDIVIPDGVVVDQIVVDTISIPEPSSMAMLALGGLAILSRCYRSTVEKKMGHH